MIPPSLRLALAFSPGSKDLRQVHIGSWLMMRPRATRLSGGQPSTKTSGGCRTGSGVNGAGLWIFTRQQQRDEQLVQKVRRIAATQGFDLSVLNDVNQTGCKRQHEQEQAAK